MLLIHIYKFMSLVFFFTYNSYVFFYINDTKLKRRRKREELTIIFKRLEIAFVISNYVLLIIQECEIFTINKEC